MTAPSSSVTTGSASAAAAGTAASTRAADRRDTRRPLDHLSQPGVRNASTTGGDGPQTFEAALRSAAGRSLVSIDAAGPELPQLSPMAVRPRPQRSARPTTEPARHRPDQDRSQRTESAGDDRRRDDTRAEPIDDHEPTEAVRSDRPERAERSERTERTRSSERSGDEPEVTIDEAGETAETGTTTEVDATTVGAVLVQQAVVPPDGDTPPTTDTAAARDSDTEPVVVADDQKVETDDGATGPETATGADAGSGTDTGNEDRPELRLVATEGADTTSDDGRDRVETVVHRPGPDAEASTEGQTTEHGSDDGRERTGSTSTEETATTAAADTRARPTTDGSNRPQVVLGAEAPRPVTTGATTQGSAGDRIGAVTGLERTVGRSTVADRFRAEAPARPTGADDAAEPDGPDAVWRQVRRALGNLRTRADGEREMVVRLRPAELGSVTVRIHTTEQGVRVALVADTAAAAGQLSQQRHHLLSELDESGLSGASVDVGQHGASDGTGPGDGTNDGRGRNPAFSAGGGTAATTGTTGGRRPGDGTRRRASGTVDLDL